MPFRHFSIKIYSLNTEIFFNFIRILGSHITVRTQLLPLFPRSSPSPRIILALMTASFWQLQLFSAP